MLMMHEKSVVRRDIYISAARVNYFNEDSASSYDNYNIMNGSNGSTESSLDESWPKYGPGEEVLCANNFFQNSTNFDLPESCLDSQSSSSNHTSSQEEIVSDYSFHDDYNYQPFGSLTLSNPPESVYHVRYLSEITDLPLDGNIVYTRNKTKKNVSGRYLKGAHGRYVTINIPTDLYDDYYDYFICVSRLTVPYQNVSYIHPYRLLYAGQKKKSNVCEGDILTSLYFVLTKAEICSRSKQFPNIVLTRRKQSELKQVKYLQAFNKNDKNYVFANENAKSKISMFQLEKSELDFRVVARAKDGQGGFIYSNLACRSMALTEREGTECKKSAVSPYLQF